MKTLCVDTTMDNLIVAITKNDKIFFMVNEEGRGTTSANIIHCIDKALLLAKLTLADIDYIGGVVGPGSFTGIRIGISLINAFNLALGKPLVALSAFEVLSHAEKEGIAVVDARHSFYGAMFMNGETQEQKEYSREEIFASKNTVYIRSNQPLDYAVTFSDKDYVNKLAKVMQKKANSNNTVPYLIPLYMKKSQAERSIDD